MPRPKIDVESKRREVLDQAEALLDRYGPDRITMQDISAACGMSQSNIYRFFANKEELLNSLANRWFDEVECALARVMQSDAPPLDVLELFIKTQFRIKRDRYDDNPELFVKYLSLATNSPAAVQEHVNTLQSWLRELVKRSLPGGTSKRTVAVIEDMTIKYRDPHLISAHRKECTDARLNALLKSVRIIVDAAVSGA